jgi:Na+/H+ antiporter NhaD/arsenite permease-like protein
MEHVSPYITALFAAILVLMIMGLALEEKIHAKKSVIVGVVAMVALFLASAFGLVHKETVDILGHPISLPVYIPGVDWEVIAIILGSSIFVDVTSKSGLFTWIAIRLTKLSGGDPLRLLIFYGVMTVVFSAVLNNVTAMIIVGTLSAVSLGKLGRPDKLLGFLLVEGLLTNVGGLLTLISSVPNIIVGNAAGISFVEFFIKASPYVLVATALTIWMGARLFRIEPLANDEARAEATALVAGFDENDGIDSHGFFWFGAIMTGLFIAAMATASITPYIRDLGLGYVALAFAAIALTRFK